MAGLLQVVVEPPQEDLLGGEGHEVVQRLTVTQEDGQVGAVLEGDLGKETDLCVCVCVCECV